MNKKRGALPASAAAAQPPNPTTLSLPSPLTLQFDPNARLQVSVAAPEKPPAPLNRPLIVLVYAVSGAAFLWVLLSLHYLALSYPQSIKFNPGSLSIAMVHPAYVAFGDDAEAELTVTNHGDSSFTGYVTLSFEGAVPIRPLPSETTTMKIENLAPHADITQRFKFALRQQTRLFSGETVDTRLRITTPECSFQPIAGPRFAVAPLPLLRTVNAWLNNSAVIAALAALLWEVMRKRLLGWEAKG